MATSDTSDYDLLTEHLSYPPVSLLDECINNVNVLADKALTSVEEYLYARSPRDLGFKGKNTTAAADANADADNPPLSPEEAATREIENGTHQLETLLNASIDKNFDIFELYAMRYIFTVAPEDRPHVRLAHYEGLDFGAAARHAGGSPPTTEGVTNLRRRLHASQRLHIRLEEEKARNEALLGKLRGALGLPPSHGAEVKREPETAGQPSGAFGFLRDKAGLEQGGGAETPISTTTHFTLSQLQALRSLSTSLRTILSDLSPQDDAETSTTATTPSWRRGRVEYVEAASRKYLETAAGLELGQQGEVRDGDWQGGARQLGRGEVEGLEKVVAILRRDGKGAGRGEAEQDAGGSREDVLEDEDVS